MKQKKSIRQRGKRTYGYGSQKKHRGAGSRGGKGYAGAFKHQKVGLKKKEPDHFSKQKFKSLRGKGLHKNMRVVNLAALPPTNEVELPGVKILSTGEPVKGVTIKAAAFSERAKEKIEKAGGKAVTI